MPHFPDYPALRAGADTASGARGYALFFTYGDQADEVALTDAKGDPLPVATQPSAIRDVIHTVSVSVDGMTAEIDAAACSAIFWTESAVEKFLLPHFTSAGGPDALRVLGAIVRAFYDYDEAAPVIALIYRCGEQAREGSVSLWDTVDVLYQTPGAGLQQVSLLQYLADFPPPQVVDKVPPPDEEARRPAPKAEEAGLMDSLDARAMAEFSSGLRGHFVWFYRDGGEWKIRIEAGEQPGEPPQGEPVVGTLTRPRRPRRPAPSQVILHGERFGKRELIDTSRPDARPDSVFWSDGAVELLLVPYYASVTGQNAPTFIGLLLAKWGGAIRAYAQEVGDISTRLGGYVEALTRQALGQLSPTLDSPAAEVGTRVSRVFAITHLPRSEYVDVIDDIAVHRRTWLHLPEGAVPLFHPAGAKSDRNGASRDT